MKLVLSLHELYAGNLTEKKSYDGLKKLRSAAGKTPTHHCSNCRCDRYSPCGCERAEEKN